MAIAYVQATQSTSGTSITINGVTTGNTLIFTAAFAGSSFPIHITGISDTLNTYSQATGAYVGDTTVDQQSDIWYASNVTGGNLTLTISYDHSVTLAELWIGEFSGIKISAPFESASNTSASSGGPVGPSLSPANVGDLLITIIAAGSGTSISISSPWIEPISPTHGTYPTAYYLPGSTSPTNAVASPNTSQNYCSSGAIFVSSPLTLSLSDTQSSSDARISDVEIPLSDTQSSNDNITLNGENTLMLMDSVTSSDTGAQSFSIQSSSLSIVITPVFETLTNALVPAVTKTYYQIEE
jgi:hypothetical protein